MSIFRVLFELFVMYLLYKLIFDFIIPVYNTTKQVKEKVGEMQQKMNEQMKQQGNQFNATTKESVTKTPREDYIEFEEIK
jgi:sortase (surface protein transpeptidase)